MNSISRGILSKYLSCDKTSTFSFTEITISIFTDVIFLINEKLLLPAINVGCIPNGVSSMDNSSDPQTTGMLAIHFN